MRSLPLVMALSTLLAPGPGGESRAATSTDFAIATNGAPTISGGLNASVAAVTRVGTTLQVTINFGEISPLNRNRLVRVVVPIGLRARRSYQLDATVTGSGSADPYGVQLSDIGFGLRDFRTLGAFATACGASSTIVTPFNKDPSVSADLSGRAKYRSSLADTEVSRTIMQGPQLSTRPINNRRANGYAVEVVLVLAPQFYSVGAFRTTLTLTLSPGPTLPCDG